MESNTQRNQQLATVLSPIVEVVQTFLKSIVANIGYKALDTSRLRKIKNTTNASIELNFLKTGGAKEVTLNDLYTEIHSLLDAVEILREVSLIHSQRPIIVLDEFDRMADANERSMFADLVKHLGDKKINITSVVSQRFHIRTS